jgi:shikimate kinase
VRNIILIGMMGCGKTSVGRVLARQLGWRFVDTDAYIEQTLGRTIPDIFAQEGEDFFREQEKLAAEKLAGEQELVIACGGGLPTRDGAIAALKGSGSVIWLRRDPGAIYDSVSMAGRPLGQGGREAFLARYRQREPIYRRWADHIIDSPGGVEETAGAILEVLQQ